MLEDFDLRSSNACEREVGSGDEVKSGGGNGKIWCRLLWDEANKFVSVENDVVEVVVDDDVAAVEGKLNEFAGSFSPRMELTNKDLLKPAKEGSDDDGASIMDDLASLATAATFCLRAATAIAAAAAY